MPSTNDICMNYVLKMSVAQLCDTITCIFVPIRILFYNNQIGEK